MEARDDIFHECKMKFLKTFQVSERMFYYFFLALIFRSKATIKIAYYGYVISIEANVAFTYFHLFIIGFYNFFFSIKSRSVSYQRRAVVLTSFIFFR